MFDLSRRVAWIAAGLGLALAGCTAPAPQASQALPLAQGVSYGTIVAIRSDAVGDARATILGAIGNPGLAGTPPIGNPMEFIIHEDNAPAPISVVQSNDRNFQAGDRIMLTRGPRITIARSGS